MQKPNKLKRTTMILLLGVFLSIGAYAAPGGIPGRPPGSGAGGGGSAQEPPDYGDLFVLLRDADGLPVLSPDSCQQPLAAPGVTLPAVGSILECIPASPTESCIIPVDPATCSVVLGYETYTQEVDFGRINEARAPASVLDAQLQEVVVRLSTADCVTLDPAGRLVTSTVTNNIVESAAIDSPLQSLAIYKQLMLVGYLGSQTAPLGLPADPLDTAARGLGAASDKAGKIGVDLVVYLNQILGLTDETVATLLPKKCINVKEEVKGVVQMVRKCFLDYGPSGGNYAYDRAATFGFLPDPAYIPSTAPQDGWFEYLSVLDPALPTFEILQGPILGAVPELMANPTLSASNIGGFAQAADDTRATIDFMHNWPVPGDYPTQLACVDSGDTAYDVSISEMSGLQVPVRMVAGTEGREFTVTVENAGPDAATGTVMVTANDQNGNSISTFPRSFNFTLLPDTSQSWTEVFTIESTGLYPTVINWTATVTAPFDVNPANNSVSEITLVRTRGRRLP